jgi:NADP-dependent 3-hydroxy acid dehydrogenase YdfG
VVFPQSDPESPLNGQNALLTGASYGIGAQIAAHLAAQGINIAIAARSSDKLEALARELRNRYGVTIIVIPADLMKHRDRESIVPAAKQGLGELDLLVNNAGVLRGGPHHLRDKRVITRMFVTNCIAGAELTHDLLPDMLARRSGHIVTIGSIAGMAASLHGGLCRHEGRQRPVQSHVVDRAAEHRRPRHLGQSWLHQGGWPLGPLRPSRPSGLWGDDNR